VIRVVTLNIWHNASDWPARRASIRRWLERLDPDILGFQEVLQGDGFDQLAELLDERWPHRLHAGPKPWSQHPDWVQGNALASRWPLTDAQMLRLPDAGDSEQRVLLHATCRSPHGSIWVGCTHLNWRLDHGTVRLRQTQAIASAIADAHHRDWPPILLGDFNASPEADEIRFLTGTHSTSSGPVHFRDAWQIAGHREAGYTWSNDNPHARRALEPQRRLDYVFVGPPRGGVGHVVACRRVFDQPVGGVWPSDHFGVMATLAC